VHTENEGATTSMPKISRYLYSLFKRVFKKPASPSQNTIALEERNIALSPTEPAPDGSLLNNADEAVFRNVSEPNSALHVRTYQGGGKTSLRTTDDTEDYLRARARSSAVERTGSNLHFGTLNSDDHPRSSQVIDIRCKRIPRV